MASTEPITGQIIPTLKGQPGYSVSQNPPFHPNILNIGGGNPLVQPPVSTFGGSTPDSTLFRGLMSTRQDAGPKAANSPQYKVNFLYNPSTITESRSVDINNGVLPSYALAPQDPSQYKTGLNATVGFSLLFDRTYELWDSSYINTDAGIYGTLVDVNAFYNMIGANTLQTATNTNIPSGANPGVTNGSYSLVVSGPMSLIPVDLYFGYRALGALKYFGIITNFDVTWTHFTQQMVPMRCAIDIGFQLYPESNSYNSQ